MKHEHFKELLSLSLLGELEADQQVQLDQHLAECGECRTELEQLQRVNALVEQSKPSAPDNRLLTEARQELRAALRVERSHRPRWAGIRDWFDALMSPKMGF